MCIFHLNFSSQNKNNQSHTVIYTFFAAILFFNVFKFFRIPISFKIRSLPSHLLQTPISAHFRASLYFIITQPFKRVFLLQFFFQYVSAFLNTYFSKIRSIPTNLLHISISELPYNSLSHSHSNVYFCCHFFFQCISAVFYYLHLFKIITLQSHFCEFQ